MGQVGIAPSTINQIQAVLSDNVVIGSIVSANERNTDHLIKQTNYTTLVKLKEIRINEKLTNVNFRVHIGLRAENAAETVSVRLYKNGTPQFSVHTTTSISEVYFDDDYSGANFLPGDLLQLYAKSGTGTYFVELYTFSLRYDRVLQTIEGFTLSTPLPVTQQTLFLTTNQDP